MAGSFVTPDNVYIDAICSTRNELLEFVSKHAVDHGIAENVEQLYQAFLAREAEGPTGMMDGFAVRHAKSDTINHAAVVIVKLKNEILDWESMDGGPITVAIALLVPGAEAGTTHLRLLAETAQALIDDDFRSDLHRAVNHQVIADLVNSKLN